MCMCMTYMAVHMTGAGRPGDACARARRPVSITLARTWAALSLVERVRFVGSLLSCGDVWGDTGAQLRARRRLAQVAVCSAGRHAVRIMVRLG